jgi:hypothetical protein
MCVEAVHEKKGGTTAVIVKAKIKTLGLSNFKKQLNEY